MLAYADYFLLDAARLLARAGDVLSRQARFCVYALTYAGVCWRMRQARLQGLKHASIYVYTLTYAGVCWRMRQARLQGLKHASMLAERDDWFTRRHGTQV
jgi:hypothetical protein